MIEHLLVTRNKSGIITQALQQLYFLIWLLLQRRSQAGRIKKAYKIMKMINQPTFRENPQRLFSYVRKIDPFVFEELLLLSFKARGIKVIHNKRYTGDGGIDGIVILKDKKRYAIQAKRYTNHINSSHVDHFKRAVINHGCHGGFFIHSGKSGGRIFQSMGASIHLISGNNLHQLLTQAFN